MNVIDKINNDIKYVDITDSNVIQGDNIIHIKANDADKINNIINVIFGNTTKDIHKQVLNIIYKELLRIRGINPLPNREISINYIVHRVEELYQTDVRTIYRAIRELKNKQILIECSNVKKIKLNNAYNFVDTIKDPKNAKIAIVEL